MCVCVHEYVLFLRVFIFMCLWLCVCIYMGVPNVYACTHGCAYVQTTHTHTHTQAMQM